MLRLHSTPADRLGWLPNTASLPTDLMLEGQPVEQLYNLMPINKPATRTAQVVAGEVQTDQGRTSVYCKTSSNVAVEVSKIA